MRLKTPKPVTPGKPSKKPKTGPGSPGWMTTMPVPRPVGPPVQKPGGKKRVKPVAPPRPEPRPIGRRKKSIGDM